jgi:excisionase family DNA binding protein
MPRQMALRARDSNPLLTIPQAARALGVSEATVWRRLRAGALPSVRRGGRRLIPARAVRGRRVMEAGTGELPAFTAENPLFAMIGMGRSNRKEPGSSDKYAVLYGPE